MATTDLLKACPLFYELYDQEIDKVVDKCSVYTFQPGDHIVKDGDEGSEIFIILDGEAWVQKKTPTGLARIQPLRNGDVFGELVLIDVRTRSADIVAETPCHVLEIKYEDIFKLYKQEPKIFSLLILNLSRLLAKRLRSSNQIILKLKG